MNVFRTVLVFRCRWWSFVRPRNLRSPTSEIYEWTRRGSGWGGGGFIFTRVCSQWMGRLKKTATADSSGERTTGWPVPHYRIAPRKVFPADNLPAKIRYDASLPPHVVPFQSYFRPGRLFWGRSYNGVTFLWGRRYFNKGRHIKSVITSRRADFSWADILTWHRPVWRRAS